MTAATDVALRIYRHDFWGIDQLVGDNLEDTATSFTAAVSVPAGRYVRHPDFRITDDYIPTLIDALQRDRVTALSLASCQRITRTGINALGAFPELTFLDLFNTGLADADLAVLGRCKNLETLNLAGTAITGSVLETIAALPRLRTLHLGFASLRGGSLSALTDAPSLAVLNLAATPIGDDDVVAVARIVGLCELGLDETLITDHAVKTLRSLSGRLTRLHLGYTGVTDECVADLCAFTALTRLNLRATHVNRANASVISTAIPALADADVNGNPRILW